MKDKTVTLTIVVHVNKDSSTPDGDLFNMSSDKALADSVADCVTSILQEAGLPASITPTHVDEKSI